MTAAGRLDSLERRAARLPHVECLAEIDFLDGHTRRTTLQNVIPVLMNPDERDTVAGIFTEDDGKQGILPELLLELLVPVPQEEIDKLLRGE